MSPEKGSYRVFRSSVAYKSSTSINQHEREGSNSSILELIKVDIVGRLVAVEICGAVDELSGSCVCLVSHESVGGGSC